MRVTGNRLLDMSAAATAANQARVAAASQEVSSGLRVAKPSDDPSAWMAAQRANAHKTLSHAASAALQAGRDRLDLADGALASIGDAVSQIRTLAVQGASASYNANDRVELAAQVRALFEGALGAANTRAADGEYIFAGTASLAAPFDASGAYAGDAIARDLPATETATTTSTIAGSALTATGGVDVLPLLDRVATALAANDVSGLQSMLGDLQTAVQQVSLTRTHVGGYLNVVDSALSANDALALHLTSEVSRQIDADVIGSATELSQASQALEASRAVTSHIVSLIDPNK